MRRRTGADGHGRAMSRPGKGDGDGGCKRVHASRSVRSRPDALPTCWFQRPRVRLSSLPSRHRHHHHVQDYGPIPACPIPTSMEKKLPIPPPTDPSVLSRGVGGDPPACPYDAARKHRFEDRCRLSVEEKATFVAGTTPIERDKGGEEAKEARTWKRKEWKLDDVSERTTCWRGWVGHESA